MAWRDRERGSETRKEAVVKVWRRRRAKGCRWGDERVGRGTAWRVEVWVGEWWVVRDVRVRVRGVGGGASASGGMGSETADAGDVCEGAEST